jgi:hypothetical protein
VNCEPANSQTRTLRATLVVSNHGANLPTRYWVEKGKLSHVFLIKYDSTRPSSHRNTDEGYWACEIRCTLVPVSFNSSPMRPSLP